MNLTTADMDRVAALINTKKAWCHYELAFTLADDRDARWWLTAIRALEESGILNFDKSPVHPVTFYMEPCIACGWCPSTSHGDHKSHQSEYGGVRAHHYTPIMYQAQS